MAGGSQRIHRRVPWVGGGTCHGAREVVEILEKLVAERGGPEFIRSDNSPEFVAWEVRESRIRNLFSKFESPDYFVCWGSLQPNWVCPGVP
jgi:hypothetical protein